MINDDFIEQLYQNNEINEYFYNQLKKKLFYLPADIQESYIQDAINMSAIGVDSSEDQKNFFYIMMHTPDILEEITKEGARTAEHVARVAAEVYENRRRFPVSSLLDFFFAVSAAAYKLGLPVKDDVVRQLERHNLKLAYPIGFADSYTLPPYNIGRWMQATRDIYSRAQRGEGFNISFDAVTENWDQMEKTDYRNWLKFYQEGAQHKYKTAQAYNADDFVPNMFNFKAQLPKPLSFEREKEEIPAPKSDINEARDRIEIQRARIVSRLNAAEKMLTSLDGQFFAGDDQELMLRLLQDLKRKVQTANKITIKSSLFEDFIYRAGNLLYAKGKHKQAKFFYKIAQEVPGGDLLAGLTPPADMPLGDLSAPMDPNAGGTSGDPVSDTRKAFAEFFERLEEGSLMDDPEEEVKKASADDEAFIVVEAQELPPPEPMEPKPELEVEEPEADGTQVVQRSTSGVDQMIDAALKNVTIQDVIKHLETVSSIFAKREVSRQLAIADLMLDKLGLSSFFPNLGEAAKSALDSNQYVSIRINEILSKLRGAVENQEADKIVNEVDRAKNSPIQQRLQQDKDKEQANKEKRKALEDAKIEQATSGKPAPGGLAEMAPEDLKQPAKVEEGQPINMPR